MSMERVTGCTLRSLQLRGASLESRVDFGRGLTVVSGPSDTGKTFMLECIDYVFGAGNPPKEIPETRGYTEVAVELVGANGEDILLTRLLSGGTKVLATVDGFEESLNAKHSAGTDKSVSQLLLGHCGLKGRRVRTNAHGKTRELSFRDVGRFAIISEESIISQRTPVESGQNTKKTVERSTFRVLVDGEDDTSVVQLPAAKDLKQQREGKTQVLRELLARLDAEVASHDDYPAADSGPELLAAVEASIARELEKLQSIRADASNLESRRRDTWAIWKGLRAELELAAELHLRFVLLGDQYRSDLERLRGTNEAGILLSELTEERCPICGSSVEHHNRDHSDALVDLEAVAVASRSEADKISLLLAELIDTINTSSVRVDRLSTEKRQAQGRLDQIDSELSDRYQPRIDGALAELQSLRGRQQELRELNQLQKQRRDLQQRLVAPIAPSNGSSGDFAQTRPDSLENLALECESLLRSWNFPNLERVVWDGEDFDLLVDGKKRKSFGKGVRALTYAAFSLGLLRHSEKRGLGHPGFVILDSPLVVYREPESDEDGEQYRVKASFYRSVARQFAASQVIVFENEEPPSDVDDLTHVTFTHSGNGRRGFVEPAAG
jgi:uncharacterized Zn finger protein (UPF0148 family)